MKFYFNQIIKLVIIFASFTNALPTLLKSKTDTEIPEIFRLNAKLITADSIGLLSVLEHKAGKYGYRVRSVRSKHIRSRSRGFKAFLKTLN